MIVMRSILKFLYIFERPSKEACVRVSPVSAVFTSNHLTQRIINTTNVINDVFMTSAVSLRVHNPGWGSRFTLRSSTFSSSCYYVSLWIFKKKPAEFLLAGCIPFDLIVLSFQLVL
jgi:hypothetical protein